MDVLSELRDVFVFYLLVLTIAMLSCLVLIVAYRIGLEFQWQHIAAVNDCIAHNLSATDGSICLV